ncbi:MAG: Gfo/Idh/MocA family protein [Candidatus Hodarchaeota archaeon]
MIVDLAKINWGILGAANIARRMVSAINETPNGKVVAIASRNLEKARNFATQYGIPKFYGNYSDLLKDKDISAIYIPVPNHLHKYWTIESAKNQKHVLCEKPFSLSVKDAEEMFKTCKENNVLVMEAFMYRFNPAIKKIKELVDQAIIGDLKYIEFNFSHDIARYIPDTDNYRFQKEFGGGALFDLGVYGLNICSFLLNAYPTQVLKSIAICDDESGIDKSFFGTLKYEEDILCNITASFQFFGKHLILSGTKGSIEVPNIISMNEIPIQVKNANFEIVKSDLSPAYDHYKEQATHFNNCIINNNEPLITAKETLNMLMTIEELFDSLIRIYK